MQSFVILLMVALLAACSAPARRDAVPLSTAPSSPAPPSVSSPPSSSASSRYYKDDGPGEAPPANLDSVADAVPRVEALHRFANRPYTVLGRDYVPATTLKSYRERGVASWYGRKFHGQKTSIGETYDMYGMTAAHPTLPLPSYARVTNVATGRTVVVRVNDRGPFLHDRVIDLSFAAAHRLGIAQPGSGEVEVEAVVPGALGAGVARAAPLPPVAAVTDTVVPVQIATVALPAVPLGTPAPVATAASGATPATAASGATPATAATPATSATSATAPPETTAMAAPAMSAAATAATASRPTTGYAVQLGAFSSYPNAQNFLAHVQNQLANAEVEARVRQTGGLYRVYVGPYAERDEARRVGERITRAFGFPTTVGPH